MKKPKRQLDDWLDAYLKYVDNTESTKNFKLWSAISGIAACLQRKCWTELGSLRLFPNLYIILVSPPGGARKGTAMDPIYRFLRELEIKIAPSSVTREALIQVLEKSCQSVTDLEGGELGFHCSLTAFCPELAVFIGNQNYNFISELTDWFDCPNRWEWETKGKGVYVIDNLWFNLIGGTTPDLIKTTLPLEVIGSGFASRILFVYESKIDKICPFPTFEKDLYGPLLSDLRQINEMQGVFKFTKEAITKYVDWYVDHSNNPPFSTDRFAGYNSRRQVHLIKLCMIMSASRSNDMAITVADFEKALTALKQIEYKMPQAFGSFGRMDNSDILSSLMREIAVCGETTYSRLLSKYLQDIEPAVLDKMLEALKRTNAITVSHTPEDTVIKWKGKSDNPLAKSMEEKDENV